MMSAPHHPPILYEGYMYKKLKRLSMPVLGRLLGMAGRGWAKRYVRLFPGKLEWYLSDSHEDLANPQGSAPVVVVQTDGTFKGILCMSKSRDETCPVKTVGWNCLRLKFAEFGDIGYGAGIAAHKEYYYMCPAVENGADVYEEMCKFERLCSTCSAELGSFGTEPLFAAFEALRAGRNSIDAALAKLTEAAGSRGAGGAGGDVGQGSWSVRQQQQRQRRQQQQAPAAPNA